MSISVFCYRPVTKYVVDRLEEVLLEGEEKGVPASAFLLEIYRLALATSQAELACGKQLAECTTTSSQQGTAEALQLLQDTIKEALGFPRLKVRIMFSGDGRVCTQSKRSFVELPYI